MNPPFPVMRLDEWKAKAAAGEAPTDVILRKSYVTELVKDEDAQKPMTICISCSDRDRDRDKVEATGCRLDNFLKNPVVMWAHMYRDLPIAKAPRTWIEAPRILSQPEFAPYDLVPLAKSVEGLLRGGFLNAASIGFRPLAHLYNDEARGFDFNEWEQLEYSIVPVPANAGALVVARSMGIDTEPLKAWAEKVLDEWHEGPGLWLPKSKVEEVFQELSTRKSVTLPEGFEFREDGTLVLPKGTKQLELQIANGEGVSEKHVVTFDQVVTTAKDTITFEDTPGAEPPAATPEDVIQFDFGEPEQPSEDCIELDCSLEELGTVITSAVNDVVSRRMTEYTGRLD